MGEAMKTSIKTWDYVLVAIGAALYVAGAFVAALTATVYSVSWFYPPAIITYLWSIWFGPLWAGIMNVIGRTLCVVAWGGSPIPGGLIAGLTVTPFEMLPAIIFYLVKGKPEMKDVKSIAVFMITVTGLVWMGSYADMFAMALVGMMPWEYALGVGGFSWTLIWQFSQVVAAAIAVPIFITLTPVIKRTGLYVEGLTFRKVPA